MKNSEKVYLEFSIRTTTIIKNELPHSAGQDIGHAIYLYPFNLETLPSKHIFKIKFESIFDEVNIKPRPTFETETEFVLLNLSENIEEDQIHNLTNKL